MNFCSSQKLKSSICDFSHHFHGFKDEKDDPQLEMLPAPDKWRTTLSSSCSCQDRGADAESPLWSHGGRQLCCSLLHNYLPCKNNKHSIHNIPLAVDICRCNKPFAKKQTHFLIYKSVPRTLEVQATCLHSQRWHKSAQIDQKLWDPLCKYANHVQNRKERLQYHCLRCPCLLDKQIL